MASDLTDSFFNLLSSNNCYFRKYHITDFPWQILQWRWTQIGSIHSSVKCFEIFLGIDFCSKEINFKSFVLIHLRARLGGFNYCTSEDNFQSCYLHLRLPADAYVSVLRIQVHFFIHAPFPKTGKLLTFCFKAYLSLRRPLSGSTITSIFEIGIVLNNVWVLEVTYNNRSKKRSLPTSIWS